MATMWGSPITSPKTKQISANATTAMTGSMNLRSVIYVDHGVWLRACPLDREHQSRIRLIKNRIDIGTSNNRASITIIILSMIVTMALAIFHFIQQEKNIYLWRRL